MKPGRELDLLIRDKIMGKKSDDHHFAGDYPGVCLYCHICGPISQEPCCPCYSTDIAAAWQVTEKMRSMNRPVRIFSDQTHKGNLWVVQHVERMYGTVIGMSMEEKLPHAICLAALKGIEQR